MNTISNLKMQKQYLNYKTNNAIKKQSEQPNVDTVVLSSPSFKGYKQVLTKKNINKIELAFLALASIFSTKYALIASEKLKAFEKEEQEEKLAIEKKESIKKEAERLANLTDSTHYRDITYNLYTNAEAEGIAEFMFDEDIYNDLKKRLVHGESIIGANYDKNEDKKGFLNSKEDVIYLGNKLKKDASLVDKFYAPYNNYAEVVALLKLNDIYPQEIKNLKEEFPYLTCSEMEKIIPTYKKDPEKTKKLLKIKNEIKELKSEIDSATSRPFGFDRSTREIELKEINKEIESNLQKILEVSPEFIKKEIEPKIMRLKEKNYNYRLPDTIHFSTGFIPNIEIEDIITAVNDEKIRDLRNKL